MENYSAPGILIAIVVIVGIALLVRELVTWYYKINKIVDFNKIQRAAIVINETPDRGYGYGNKYWKKGYGEYKGKMSIA